MIKTNNYTNDNTARRYKAHVSVLGTTQLHLRSPYIIAWWSAAFPGFGHLLLSKYLRGYALFIWEVVVNVKAHVNAAMVYSFQGNIDVAKAVLDTRWLLMYIPVYLFGIWDSYRTTVDLNKVYLLAEREDHRFNSEVFSGQNKSSLSPMLSPRWNLTQRIWSANEEAGPQPGLSPRQRLHNRATDSVPSIFNNVISFNGIFQSKATFALNTYLVKTPLLTTI